MSSPQGFDELAPYYRRMEHLGARGKLQDCRAALLPRVMQARRVLIAGEGPGCFLEAACPLMPEATFTIIDASAPMLHLARQAWLDAGGGPERARFVQASLPEDMPGFADKFDLIVTPFFLDCFEPPLLDRIIYALAAAACEDARWLLADFRLPAHGWDRLRARLQLWAAYRVYGLAAGVQARRLVDPAPMLQAAGFALEEECLSDRGMLSARLFRRMTAPSA